MPPIVNRLRTEHYRSDTPFPNLNPGDKMKYLPILLMLLLTSCSTLSNAFENASPRPSPSPHTTRARITFYGGSREAVACSGRRAVQGISVAAHPKYPFGTKISIPELEPFLGKSNFKVEDRGSAVTSRKASRGTADVFDIYVRNQKTLRYLENSAPEYMTVNL